MQLTVGMGVYDRNNFRCGKVAQIFTDATGVTAIHVESHGPLTKGTRRVEVRQFTQIAKYVMLRMTRPEFRKLPQIR